LLETGSIQTIMCEIKLCLVTGINIAVCDFWHCSYEFNFVVSSATSEVINGHGTLGLGNIQILN